MKSLFLLLAVVKKQAYRPKKTKPDFPRVALTGRPFYWVLLWRHLLAYWIFTSLTANRPTLSGLEGKIADIIVASMEAQGYELVRVQVIGLENPTVQIMADRADNAAFTLDDCTAVSHLVSALLDVEDPITSAWTLEVSSAGIDRPLTRVKDWNRYAGHLAKVELNFPGPGGRKRFTGAIISADELEATIKTDTGDVLALKLADVKKARLLLTDALIAATTTEQPPTN